MSSNSFLSSAEVADQVARLQMTVRRWPDRPSTVQQGMRINGYWLALILVALAFLLRVAADPWLGDQSPYLPFVVAVAVTGLYAGVRPALMAAALGTIIAYFCFVPPRYRFGFAGFSDVAGFGVYVLGVGAVILLTHARIRAANKAEQHREESERIQLKTERLAAAGRMAALLAHEINNPLAALTNIMFLLDQQQLNGSSRELVSAGTDSLNRINRIAAMTIGFFFDKDTPESIQVCEIVDKVAETLGSADRFTNIRLSRDFKAFPAIVISPTKMKQLIVNLLTNAMESGATSVRIRVAVRKKWNPTPGYGVRILFADNGCGIQPLDREKVFEPFFSSKPEKGAGLGLWASRAIAVRNGGEIRLRSAVTGPRKGTTVSVFLPTISEPNTFVFDVRRSVASSK